MKTIFSTPKELLEEDINSLFIHKEKNDIDLLFSIISLILFKNAHNTDMIDLFKALNENVDLFSKIIALFDGRTITFPKSQDLSQTFLLAISYYYREIENKSWNEIKEILPEIDSEDNQVLSLSLRIHNLNDFLKQRIQESMEQHKNGIK